MCAYVVSDLTAGCTRDWEQMGAVLCVYVCVWERRGGGRVALVKVMYVLSHPNKDPPSAHLFPNN